MNPPAASHSSIARSSVEEACSIRAMARIGTTS
jgi:hypothetical protein